MVCVSFYVICIVELLVSNVICRFSGLVLFTLSFLLFCLFIIIFIFILNYVLIVKFGIFIYYKIWILLNIYCFIWNYLWHVWKCFGVLWVNSYQLVMLVSWVMQEWACIVTPLVVLSKAPIGVVVKLLTFLNLYFIMEWLLQSYFS